MVLFTFVNLNLPPCQFKEGANRQRKIKEMHRDSIIQYLYSWNLHTYY